MRSLGRSIFVLAIFFSQAAMSQESGEENIETCMRGWDATESGDHAGAVALFEECIKNGNLSQASLARTYRNIGIAYRRGNQPAKAVEAYGKAIALQPADIWDDYVNRGNAYSDLGDFDSAFKDYDLAQEAFPDYGEAFYNRGIVFERLHKMDQAKAQFIKAYKSGLRSSLLLERLSVHGVADPDQ